MTNYEQDGYTVISDVLTDDQLQKIHDETEQICRHVGHDDVSEVLCVHFPHKISDLLLQTAQLTEITEALTRCIGPNVKMMQSMLFIKAAGKPGQAWHQDETHIPTRDRSLTAVWLALDDATTENGCLWVIPGSHRDGFLFPDHDQSDPRFDCTKEAHGFTDDQAVPVELKAGDALVFDGHLLHRSLPNTSSGMRRGYVTHYMNAGSLLPWFPPSATESMGTTDHRDIVMVAGADPYAFKGIIDLMRPHVRPVGDGGCAR